MHRVNDWNAEWEPADNNTNNDFGGSEEALSRHREFYSHAVCT